jgi:GntR family transcriptional regulator
MQDILSADTPAYKRIQTAIRERIQSGHLRLGDVVASERELARLHRVSLMTARHALVELEREGIVERRRGAGTFVCAPKVHFNKLMSYTELMSSRGLVSRSRVLFADLVEGEEEVAARLTLPPSSQLLKIKRLRLVGEEPFALETCYLSAIEFSALTTPVLSRSSLFSILERDFGVELAYADEEIDVSVADAKLASLLQLRNAAPVMRIRQVIYSTKSKPILYVVGCYRSDRHKLFIRRFR